MNLLPLIPAPWRSLLDDKTLHTLTTIGDFLDGENFQPQTDLIFRALALTDPMAVRCIILGQDPYPTPRVPTGLAFDVGAETIIPASLRNIFHEYTEDLGFSAPKNGDLSPWTQRVLLLNSALTCRVGVAGSHAGCGWHDVTSALLRGLSEINGDVVYLCWGQPALRIIQKLKVSADVHGRIIASPHPSPLSAYRGFFGSKPFTRTNHLLAELNREPIDWQLP